MNFLQTQYDDLKPENIVVVSLDRQANVQLLDDVNLSRYRSGQRFEYYGGLAKSSPVRLSPPRRGRWHLVVDMGGYGGTVNVGAKVL